jgi:hypothetical protein
MRFQMVGVTMAGGWFWVNPTETSSNVLNDHNNRYLYRSNNSASYFFGSFKDRKLVACYFYNKGEMVEWPSERKFKLSLISVFGLGGL